MRLGFDSCWGFGWGWVVVAGYTVSTAAGLGSAPLGVAVSVGVRVGVHRLPVCLTSSRRGSAWRPAAVAGWVAGLGGGAAGRGVRRVVLCGAQGSRGAAGAAGVGVSTFVGWPGVGLGVMSHRRLPLVASPGGSPADT